MFRRTPSPQSSREGSPNIFPPDTHPKVGNRVIVRSQVGEAKTGILRYVGDVKFAQGCWAGVELFYPQGKNDGSVEGQEYFRCQQKYGLFVPIRKVDWSPMNAMGVNVYEDRIKHETVK